MLSDRLRRSAGRSPGITASGSAAPVEPLIPNEDLTPLPAEVTPIPATLLTGHWSLTAVAAQSSADMPDSFGFVCLMAIDGDLRIALSNTGDTYRLDILDGGGAQQCGVMEWLAGATFVIDVDVAASTITVTSADVTFTGGWDTVVGNVATKVLTPWTWAGTTVGFGGVGGNFHFVGTIQDVVAA